MVLLTTRETAEVCIKKSKQMQNMHVPCAEPEENAGHAITYFPTKMLQEEKKSAIEGEFFCQTSKYTKRRK